MNPGTARNPFRFYFYSLFAVLCLVGLMQASTIISSSRALKPDGASTSGEAAPRNVTIGASYRIDRSPLTNELRQLVLEPPADKIAARVSADTADGQSTSVVIMLTEQADVSSAYAITDQDARGWYVYNTLTQHAARTQVGLQNFLKSEGVNYQSFWAANMIVATADRSLVDKLAARADVARVDSNLPSRWIEDPVLEKFGDRKSVV